MNQKFRLCAFADEAGAALDEQIDAMRGNGIRFLEMRGVDGKNVADLTAAEARAAKAKLDAAGLEVWSLGSPAGKTKITDDFAPAMEQFKRLLEVADITDAKRMRIFSFYETNGDDACFDEVCERLDRFLDEAERHGVTLCHENEKGIYGDTAARCVKLLRALPRLRAVYDPANFLQCGENTLDAWDALDPYLSYMHIKDCARGGDIVPPGEGEGRLPELLARYAKRGGGVLTMEPHLVEFVGLAGLENEGDKSAVGGRHFASGREAFDFAVRSLKAIADQITE